MTMLTAMVMFYLGLSTLGFVPSIASLGLRFPRLAWHDNQGLQNKNVGALLLRASTFFLLCGFTQSMQIFALGSRSAWQGALTLFLFALRTVPVLFGAGYFASTLAAKKSGIFAKTVGLLILLFSLTIVNNALAIKGKQINLAFGDNSETAAQDVSVDIPDREQTVQMDVLARSFSPNVLVVQKDMPVKWIINGDQASGCTNEIIVPAYNLRQKISPGGNVIEFTPTSVGDTGFSCWMGMVHGIIRVVEATQ
jgi:cytochrome c biogenesis DsbD-like protein